MKKLITIVVATATLTRGGALVVNGTHMLRSSERIALGITLPQQAIGRTLKITVDEGKDKTPSGLIFAEIDSTMINDACATRLEVVRVYQTALRNNNQVSEPESQPIVADPLPVTETVEEPVTS